MPQSVTGAAQLGTVHISRVTRRADLRRAKELVERIYGERYGVSFTDGTPDPHQRLEPWPDRFVMAQFEGRIVAVGGLYTGITYAERYSGLTRADLEAAVASAGVDPRGRDFVEYGRLTVAPGWEGIGPIFLTVTHSRGFLAPEGGRTPFVLACAKVSVFRLCERARIKTRTLGLFPSYPSHERYRTPTDPMETRITIPELDLDPLMHALQLPLNLDLAIHGVRRVA
ncbi:MAG: hypothetical protein KC621_10530 [Myxococcales bacterium]|nr:hypothetical protein [Myxococcales bacterium]